MLRRGFSLLELSIVLIIIGLILAVVIRGAVLRKSAKVDATVSSFQINYNSTEAYFNLYRNYPGDLDGDGKIESDGITELESKGFTVKKTNPYGGGFSILWQNYLSDSGNYIITTNIPPDVDSLIDQKIDDGDINTGRYRRFAGNSVLKI